MDFASKAFDENILTAMDAAEFGDLIYDMLLPIMAHTRIRRNFAAVFVFDEEWRRVCRSVERMRDRHRSQARA